MDITQVRQVKELDSIRLLEPIECRDDDGRKHILPAGEWGTVLVVGRDSFLVEFGIEHPSGDLLKMDFVEVSVDASQCDVE